VGPRTNQTYMQKVLEGNCRVLHIKPGKGRCRLIYSTGSAAARSTPNANYRDEKVPRKRMTSRPCHESVPCAVCIGRGREQSNQSTDFCSIDLCGKTTRINNATIVERSQVGQRVTHLLVLNCVLHAYEPHAKKKCPSFGGLGNISWYQVPICFVGRMLFVASPIWQYGYITSPMTSIATSAITKLDITMTPPLTWALPFG
jgi:hypothetical protein